MDRKAPKIIQALVLFHGEANDFFDVFWVFQF